MWHCLIWFWVSIRKWITKSKGETVFYPMCLPSIHQPRAPQENYYREETWGSIVLGSNLQGWCVFTLFTCKCREGLEPTVRDLSELEGLSNLSPFPGVWLLVLQDRVDVVHLFNLRSDCCVKSCAGKLWEAFMSKVSLALLVAAFKPRILLRLSHVYCQSRPWLADWTSQLDLALPQHLWTVTDPGCITRPALLVLFGYCGMAPLWVRTLPCLSGTLCKGSLEGPVEV